MDATYKIITTADLPDFFEEVARVASIRQPNLSVELLGDAVILEGPFVCYSDAGPFDAFDVRIRLEAGFPVREPIVHETFGRIPRDIDRHMYNSERCCLGIWWHWLWKNPDADFESFLTGPVHDFFVSQVYFEKRNEWPFGEREHGFKGQADAYLEILKLPGDADVSAALSLLGVKVLKGHHVCPCGSKQRLRDCHFAHFVDLRAKLDPIVRLGMVNAGRAHRRSTAKSK